MSAGCVGSAGSMGTSCRDPAMVHSTTESEEVGEGETREERGESDRGGATGAARAGVDGVAGAGSGGSVSMVSAGGGGADSVGEGAGNESAVCTSPRGLDGDGCGDGPPAASLPLLDRALAFFGVDASCGSRVPGRLPAAASVELRGGTDESDMRGGCRRDARVRCPVNGNGSWSNLTGAMAQWPPSPCCRRTSKRS